ncbi:MAG: hypothetical protein MJ239_07610 [Bacilli bacterium]|nr:hypothetical protein [Bacilli bacterium]
MGLFSKTIRTNSEQRNPRLRPIGLKMSSQLLYDKLESFCKQKQYDDVVVSRDYHEVFATTPQAEFTFMVFVENGHAVLSVMVYVEDRVFAKKRILLNVMNELREYFSDSLL